MSKKNRAERRAVVQVMRERRRGGSLAAPRLASSDFGVGLHEGGCDCCGRGGDDLLFECPTGKLAHGVSLRLDASPEEIERFREELLRGGPDALLPCGACRAGDVFTIFD